jgi:hypothetical protein
MKEMPNMKKTDVFSILVRVVGELLFLFGFLGWVYGVVVQLTHPYWLPMPLSHLIRWIRIDTFAVLSFAASAVGFFFWRLTKELNAGKK